MILNQSEILELRGEQLQLLAEKAIWWEKEGVLILSDLHLGKSAHFRKNGIAIPKQANTHIVWALSELILKFKPKELLLLGDLFHSDMNEEWAEFVDFRMNFPEVVFRLVLGNHDLMSLKDLKEAEILHTEEYRKGPFVFLHEAPAKVSKYSEYILSGHVHPAVRLKGVGKQSMRLPCFYFTANSGILPSFGYFTGSHTLKVKKDDLVYVTNGEEIFKLSL